MVIRGEAVPQQQRTKDVRKQLVSGSVRLKHMPKLKGPFKDLRWGNEGLLDLVSRNNLHAEGCTGKEDS